MFIYRVRKLGSAARAILLILGAMLMFPIALRSQWTQALSRNGFYSVNSFSNSGSRLYAGGDGNWVVLSTDNGVTWWKQYGVLPAEGLGVLAAESSNLYATLLSGFNNSVRGIARSTDEGASWLRVGFGLTDSNVTSLAVLGTMVFAGTYRGETFDGTDTGGGVFRSTDSGMTWAAGNNGLSPEAPVYKLVANGSRLYAGTGSGIFASNDSGNTWTRVFTNWPAWRVTRLAVSGNNIITNIEGLSFKDIADSIFFSPDNGLHWRLVTLNVLVPGAGSYLPFSFVFSGSKLFALIEDAVLMSTDSGQNWTATDGPSDYNAVMTISGPNLLVGTNAAGIMYSRLSDLETSSVTQKDISDPVFILPNPTTGPITIRGATGAMDVTNVLGQRVAGTGVREPGYGDVELDLSKLPAGTYFARIETSDGIIMRKLVKE